MSNYGIRFGSRSSLRNGLGRALAREAIASGLGMQLSDELSSLDSEAKVGYGSDVQLSNEDVTLAIEALETVIDMIDYRDPYTAARRRTVEKLRTMYPNAGKEAVPHEDANVS